MDAQYALHSREIYRGELSEAINKLLHHDFSDELHFTESENAKERRAIAALFTVSKDDKILKVWLDSQIFHFNKWSSEDSDTVVRYIIDHQDDFPTICNKSVFIKNRIKSKIDEE
ncbi:hypothetical protein [Edaphovirga cremea]|uniref:hypothetical protein n=1 Tax=Edaphovirga cremea TaxID=2267246 RepID=UPI000DEF70E9|nr:hypothetical protein [Edaphovirga cremea]